MSEKNLDYRKVDQPKAPSKYPNLNGLDESLKDLETFEKFVNTDRIFQNPTGDRQINEGGEPYDVVEKPNKIKKAADKKGGESIEEKDIKNIELKLLDEVLKNYKEYEKYLGIANDDLPGVKDELVNTKEFPMNSDKPKIASKKKL